MADFNGTILTTQGLNLLAQAQAGETLQFTQVVLGSGTWSSTMNPSSMTSLVYPSQTVPIQSVSVVGDGTARIRFLISNSSLSVGYLLSEIGIYAQTQSSPNTLYAVTYANNPDFVPASGVTTIEDVIDIYTVVSNAQSVTAVIDNSVMLATMQDLYTARPEFSSSTPTDLYAGKIWVSDTQPAEFYDGTQWRPFNAGLLNGYGVSATPQPNTILPLNANAQFPYSVLPSGIANGYANPINLTSATADYLLQVGEVAYISFTNATSVPLHIAIANPSLYWFYTNGGACFLAPNNTSYSNQFYHTDWGFNYSSSSVASVVNGVNASYFALGNPTPGFIISYIDTSVFKTITQQAANFSSFPYSIRHVASHWANPVSWTSLGTITFPQATTGYVLVRRLA